MFDVIIGHHVHIISIKRLEETVQLFARPIGAPCAQLHSQADTLPPLSQLPNRCLQTVGVPAPVQIVHTALDGLQNGIGFETGITPRRQTKTAETSERTGFGKQIGRRSKFLCSD